MGFFDNQLQERKKLDNDMFTGSIAGIAGAIVGSKITHALKNSSRLTSDAIEEVLEYYGISAKEISENIEDYNAQLDYQLRPHGINRRIINLDKYWYKLATGAILGTRKDDGTVVAFIPGRLGGYYFYNSKTGKRERVNKKNSVLFDTEALAFYLPLPLKKLTIKDLLQYIMKQISLQDILLTVLFMAFSTGVGLIVPKINSMLFGTILDSGSVSLLMAMAVLLICISLAQVLFSVNNTMISARISTKLELSVEAATMMRIMSLPADFFKKYSSGELTNYSQYMTVLCQTFINSIGTVGMSSLFSLAYIGSILEYAPGLVGPAFAIIGVTVVFSVCTSLVQMKITRKQMEIGAAETGISYALISGVQKIKLAGAEKRAFSKWADLYTKDAKLSYNPPLFIKINSALSTLITAVGTIVMYYAAIKTHVSYSEYFAFNSAYAMISAAFVALAGIAPEFAKIRPILDILKPIMDTEPETSESRQIVTKVRGEIELNNVSFKYTDDMPNVIDNITLHIKSGQYVAIVGKTGCGKSTLVRLLLGFERPQKGAIYYDKRDINTLDLKSLRRKIGVVLQNGSLINADIFSNITISAPWLSVDDAWEAAEIAGIADDIRKMPMGMYTLLSEGSGGISGGQKQRIMIARAIAPKPRILIFDEATSALDNITQKQVSQALDSMKCTRLVIAHRLSTIKQCDRIVYLEDGHIMEDGTYDELIEKNGLFADLVRRQQINPDSE